MIGETSDKFSQDVITDSVFTPILPACSPFRPPCAADVTASEIFQTIPGFLFSSRLTADGVWQVTKKFSSFLFLL